jgi:hypothetical protein
MELKHQIDSDLEKLLKVLCACITPDCISYNNYSYTSRAKKELNVYFFGKEVNFKEIIFDLFNKCKIGDSINISQSFQNDFIYWLNKSTITSHLTFLTYCGFITKIPKTTLTYRLNAVIPDNLKISDIKDEKNLKKIQRRNKLQSINIK